MIVDSALYRDGVRVQVDCHKDDLNAVRDKATGADDFVWVGLHRPSEDELNGVAKVFSLHPLAVDEGLFLVLKTLWYVDEEDAVETGEINLFVGRNYIVSVRHGEGAELHSARMDLEQRTHVLGHGPSAVVYAICDRVVDEYELVSNSLEEDVDEVETSVFSTTRTQDSQRIYVLKRELSEMRRAVNPLREPMKRFATGSVPFVTQEAAPFFRDVTDHLLRVSENIETLDSLLSTAFDAHLAQISVQQNEDMRKISAWVAIAAVGTLVAGIYGMNFINMPELRWHYGYFYALGLMAFASILLYRLFKRSGWL
jgi:magnesium transporter